MTPYPFLSYIRCCLIAVTYAEPLHKSDNSANPAYDSLIRLLYF